MSSAPLVQRLTPLRLQDWGSVADARCFSARAKKDTL